MALEKRKERRLKVNLPIKISFPNNPEISSRTENISRLGAYIHTEKKIPVGKDVEVVLEIPSYKDKSPSGVEIKCKANVFRCTPLEEIPSGQYYGIGIFFTEFPKDADKDRLSKYVDYLISQEDEAVKKGMKRWQDKRAALKAKKHTERGSEIKEALHILKQILSRLEEIKNSVESQKNNPA